MAANNLEAHNKMEESNKNADEINNKKWKCVFLSSEYEGSQHVVVDFDDESEDEDYNEMIDEYMKLNQIQKIEFIKEEIKKNRDEVDNNQLDIIFYYNLNSEYEEDRHIYHSFKSSLDMIFFLHENGIKIENGAIDYVGKLTVDAYIKLANIGISRKKIMKHIIKTSNPEALNYFSDYPIPNLKKIKIIYSQMADFEGEIQNFVIHNRNNNNFDNIYKKYTSEIIDCLKILQTKVGADIESYYLLFVRLIIFSRYGTKNLIHEIYQMLISSVFSPHRVISVPDEVISLPAMLRMCYVICEERLFRKGSVKLFEILLIFIIVYGYDSLLKYFAKIDEFIYFNSNILFASLDIIYHRKEGFCCTPNQLIKIFEILKENGYPLVSLWNEMIEKKLIKIFSLYECHDMFDADYLDLRSQDGSYGIYDSEYCNLLSYIVKNIGPTLSSNFLSITYTKYILDKREIRYIDYQNFCFISAFMSYSNLSVLHDAFKKILHFVLDFETPFKPNKYLFKIMNATSRFNDWVDNEIVKKLENRPDILQMINSSCYYHNISDSEENIQERESYLDIIIEKRIHPYCGNNSNYYIDHPLKK